MRTGTICSLLLSLLGAAQCNPSPAVDTSPDVCAVGCSSSSSLPSPSNALQLEPKAKVSDACASYHDLDTLNQRLHPYVRNLANNTDFFSYYRLNLYNKVCPFWNDDNGLCGNRACAVITLDNEEDVPEIWRAAELSKLEGPKAQHPGKKQQKERDSPLMGQLGESVGESCVVEYDDECDERDYCVPEDESAAAKGDYVSLVDNPERFTGYSGEGAHQVWESIYRENCFSKPPKDDQAPQSSTPMSGFSSLDQRQAALQLKDVIKAGSPGDTFGEFDDECIEKRVFYRVISGMHASISTHLCYDYLNQQTGEWGPNLTCYKERLHNRPDRISNIYFNFALMSRAVGKLRDYVQDYVFCTGDPSQDAKTKKMITTLANAIPPGPQIFDESVMFQDQTLENGISLKEDFRNRFRNVSRVMDCVGCDKCRLWGKIQTNGFGTALKVLFEFGQEGESKPLLRRTELVALINTLDKISTALKHLDHFKAMVEAENAGATESEVENTPLPKASSPATSLEDLEEFSSPDPPPAEPGLSELFWEEFDNVWTAYKYVLWSWSQIPILLPTIVLGEVGRLSDMWLGRPVREREWEVKAPTLENVRAWKGRDEL